MFRLSYALILALLAVSSALSASFDCDRAVTEVERMICKDHRLSRLDDELALSFRSALSKVQDKHPLRQEQKAWLVRRDGCSKVDMQGKEVVDTDCLWFSYQVRTARLKAISMKHAAEPKADKAEKPGAARSGRERKRPML